MVFKDPWWKTNQFIHQEWRFLENDHLFSYSPSRAHFSDWSEMALWLRWAEWWEFSQTEIDPGPKIMDDF